MFSGSSGVSPIEKKQENKLFNFICSLKSFQYSKFVYVVFSFGFLCYVVQMWGLRFFCLLLLIRCAGNTSGATANVPKVSAGSPTLPSTWQWTVRRAWSLCAWISWRVDARGICADISIRRPTCRRSSKPPRAERMPLPPRLLW